LGGGEGNVNYPGKKSATEGITRKKRKDKRTKGNGVWCALELREFFLFGMQGGGGGGVRRSAKEKNQQGLQFLIGAGAGIVPSVSGKRKGVYFVRSSGRGGERETLRRSGELPAIIGGGGVVRFSRHPNAKREGGGKKGEA